MPHRRFRFFFLAAALIAIPGADRAPRPADATRAPRPSDAPATRLTSPGQAGPGPTFVLDVGAPGDSDPSAAAWLDEVTRLSDRQSDGTRDWRTLDEGGYLYWHVRPAGVDLAANGVPYRDAIVDVTFRDTSNETNCARVQSTRAYCRPRLATRLDYGEPPLLTWLGLAGLGGLADDQWKLTSAFLEATPWQTLRAIDGLFEFYVHYPNQLAEYAPLPIDSVRLRFVDPGTLAAEREVERADRGLIRSDFVETRSPAVLPSEDSFVVYARNYLTKIYPNTVPAPAWITDSLRVFEVAGESEPLTFAVYALRDVQGLTVRATDFTSGRAVIPAANVALNLVGALDKRWGWGYDRYYGRNPWVLADLVPFDVAAGTSRQVWATVAVPADAPPGEYHGALIVEAPGAPAVPVRRIEVALDVYRVDLAPPDATPYLYHSPYLTYKQFAPRRTTAVRDMAAHDINPIIYLDAQIDLHEYTVDVRDLPAELAEFQSLGILPPGPRVGVSDNVDALWRQLCPGIPVFSAGCGDFDAAYGHVLEQYRDAFAAFGVVPALSFTDEPGEDPERRIRSNYLHRLTRRAGLTTWVTYYPQCEKPLAGYTFEFDDLAVDVAPVVPEWLMHDAHVKGWWDFTDGPSDRSTHANDGVLSGGARIEDGALVLPDERAAMRVSHDASLDLTTSGTVYFWMKPAACSTAYAWHPIAKWPGTVGANFVFYFFGDYGGQYPDNRGLLRMYADAGGQWSAVSGGARIDCLDGLDRWYNVAWSYDAGRGGTLHVNGVPFADPRTGTLATNGSALDLGRFPGVLDEVIVLDRALTADEALDIARSLNATYDRGQAVRLTLEVADRASVPETMTFSIHDDISGAAGFESTKRLTVNGRTVWSTETIDRPYDLVTVDLAPYLSSTDTNRFEWSVTNGQARQERLSLYFVDDFWRRAPWTVNLGANWRGDYDADESGALGPMDPHLDDRVYALSYVTGPEADRTRAAGDTFSYYTTYPATQPVIVNNRFLNGVYAAALGASGVYVYAYGDWGAQPWDDTEPYYAERLGNETARRSQNNYQLVLPSWEDRVYDTVAFEALREGIEDARVIATLRDAIAKHPGPEADAAEAYLNDLLDRLPRAYAPRYMSVQRDVAIERYADRSAEMLTDLAGDPEAYGALDEARLRMLRHIAALTRAPSPPPMPGACFIPYAARR